MLSITVNYTYTGDDDETVSDTCVIHISENPEERAVSDAAVAEGNASTAVTKYVRVGDSQIVYTMDNCDQIVLDFLQAPDREKVCGQLTTIRRIVGGCPF